jgi:hypothetical protein
VSVVRAEAQGGRDPAALLPSSDVRLGRVIVTQDKLLELAGLRQKAALRRHLRQAHIPFRELNGRIFTTQAALDAAMVGREKTTKRGPNLDALATKSSG